MCEKYQKAIHAVHATLKLLLKSSKYKPTLRHNVKMQIFLTQGGSSVSHTFVTSEIETYGGLRGRFKAHWS